MKQIPGVTPLTPRVLNIDRTAAYLGVGVSKFNDMRKLGIFTVQTLPYGAYYDVRQVDEWLNNIGGLVNMERAHQKAWLEATDG